MGLNVLGCQSHIVQRCHLPVVTKDLPISPRFSPFDFLSQCKFSTLTTHQSMVEGYLLMFSGLPLRKTKENSAFNKIKLTTSTLSVGMRGHPPEDNSSDECVISHISIRNITSQFHWLCRFANSIPDNFTYNNI